ncbi:hypothetical protein EW146_g4192, partial [Bondarzewia mesenterica]
MWVSQGKPRRDQRASAEQRPAPARTHKSSKADAELNAVEPTETSVMLPLDIAPYMHVQLEASRSPAWKPDAQTPTHPHRCSRSSLPLPLLPATIYERSDPQPRIWNSVHALATRRQRRNTEEQKTL